MSWKIELRQHVLDDEVATVLNKVSIRQLDVEILTSLGHQCQRYELCTLIELGEFAVQEKLHRLAPSV
ncbi:hypothetical protein D3C73_1503790 [compost metagenome]